jgi:hypothetical protein
MDIKIVKPMRCAVLFKSADTFWGKTQYFEKDIILNSDTTLEKVKEKVESIYPKYIYFKWLGQIVKNGK